MSPNDSSAAPARAPETAPNALQFDRAEPLQAPAGNLCDVCQTPISDNYYLLNGATICGACAETARTTVREEPRPADLTRAVLYGSAAALAGTGVYFAILALSGYEIGWIAVAVGWFVGKAVRKGGRGLGGRRLQWIAVLLTYFSIVGSYVPLIIKSALENPPGKQQSSTTQRQAPQSVPAEKQPSVVVEPPRLSIGGFLLGLAILFGYALVLPFLQGLSSILSLFIIAIGLFEAWKLNRRIPMTVDGPYPVGPAAESA